MATRIIAVGNQKGGVGKTTTSVNLSACLAEKGKKILLIDMDPQANATSGLGIEKKEGRSLYGALLGESPLNEQIQRSTINRLDIIAAEVDLAGAEIDVARSDNYLHRMSMAMKGIVASPCYDYIIIDCPPSLGILTMNTLTAADSLLLPMQCEYYALEGLSVMTRLVDQLRGSGANPRLEIEGIVMTMYDMRTNLSLQVVQEVTTHFGDILFETLIPRSVRLSEAPSFGQPITQYDPRCTGAVAYRQLAKEFLARRKSAESMASSSVQESSVQESAAPDSIPAPETETEEETHHKAPQPTAEPAP